MADADAAAVTAAGLNMPVMSAADNDGGPVGALEIDEVSGPPAPDGCDRGTEEGPPPCREDNVASASAVRDLRCPI
jgi:hypothetical protein